MKTVIKIRCMHCGWDMGQIDGEGVEGDSHSICEPCWYDRHVFGSKESVGLYPDERERMVQAAEIALILKRSCDMQIFAPTIIWPGMSIRAELVKARGAHDCRYCPEPITRGALYYSVIVGSGLGAIKRPDRVHTQCLERYLSRYQGGC